MRRVVYFLSIAALCATAAPAVLAAQQPTLVTGRVVDRATQRPIPEVQVLIVGTNRGTRTDAEGRYRIVAQGGGAVQVRALRIGYASETQAATLTEGQATT